MTSDIRDPSDASQPERESEPEPEPEIPPFGPEPWWADLGAVGGLVIAVLGVVAVVVLLLGVPGLPQGSWTSYYQWAKVVAVGAVVAGTTMFSRRRNKPSPSPEEAPDDGR
ncbi:MULTISPECIES: hypothetical protein [unclassified Streptomyces]|uniref:hypothetical protein n=1 Tax=unclassified Streptomyces TaxID=2593676 RepID=UPI002DD9A0F1|nr:hypothetical protein [Streptomyces sp. NBC_01795]WSA93517.1 hypothetical protein OIE63_19485 [Streptomyces sp. NBC_01795]WSS42681.1 hypothetical protein OG220_20410 [Streptomyces sp. NBC_01187]